MHITHEQDRWTLLRMKQIGSCSLYIQGLGPFTYISNCCLSSFQDEQPGWTLSVRWVHVQGLGQSCACVHRSAARHGGSDSAGVWHPSTLLAACPGDWSSRASLNLLPDECAIALTDPRPELLPKYWQNQRLLQQVARAIKPSGFSEPSRTAAHVFIHTSRLFCHKTLPITESYPDIFCEIKIHAIHISHCDPLQSRFFWK